MLSFTSHLESVKLAVTHASPKARHQHSHSLAGPPALTKTPSEILPRLWLSGLYTAVDEEQLMALGVTHIVSVIERRPKYPRSLDRLKTLHIPVQDGEYADILQHLDVTTAFIKSALEDKRNVLLVHCAMGISRSATVVCAYLIAVLGMSPADALDFLSSKREIVRPNAGFRRQLNIYAARVHGPRKLRKSTPPVLPIPLALPRRAYLPESYTPPVTRSRARAHSQSQFARSPPPPAVRSTITPIHGHRYLPERLPHPLALPPPSSIARRGSMS